ncbi:hypothetical protein SPRG_06556, partial [Saprolegnia parasitica CBS 223.65]
KIQFAAGGPLASTTALPTLIDRHASRVLKSTGHQRQRRSFDRATKVHASIEWWRWPSTLGTTEDTTRRFLDHGHGLARASVVATLDFHRPQSCSSSRVELSVHWRARRKLDWSAPLALSRSAWAGRQRMLGAGSLVAYVYLVAPKSKPTESSPLHAKVNAAS